MELRNKIVRIVEKIADDARNKWSSHDEEENCINEYVDKLENLILFGVSSTFTEKEKEILTTLIQLEIHLKTAYNSKDKDFKEFINSHNKLIQKIKSQP